MEKAEEDVQGETRVKALECHQLEKESAACLKNSAGLGIPEFTRGDRNHQESLPQWCSMDFRHQGQGKYCGHDRAWWEKPPGWCHEVAIEPLEVHTLGLQP